MSSRRAAKQRRRPSSAKKPSRDREGVSKLVSVLVVVMIVASAAALVLLYSGMANDGRLRASFDMDEEEGFTPLTIHFTDTSAGGPTEWEWDFDDDGVVDSIERDPSYTYRFGGVYDVSLTIRHGDFSDVAVRTVTVHARLSADFSYTPSYGNAPLTVQFADLSTGNKSIEYVWDFGDGATSIERSPKHTYLREGNFTVTLTVSEGEHVQSKSVVIPVTLIPPTASFVVQTNDPKVGSETLFQDTSINAPSNWTWEFGDGTKGYGRQPKHIYSKAGVYAVNLTAWNLAGGNATQTIITVRELTVEAMFSVDVQYGFAPLTVTFSDHSVNATSWHWKFGDGSESNARSPTYTYTVGRDAPYIASLTVSNGLDTDTFVLDIDVYAADPPKVNFTATPRVGVDSVLVRFTDLSTNGPTEWEWDLDGDGIVDLKDQHPSFEYTEFGRYDVTLRAYNEFGWSSLTKPSFIVISTETPVASFESDVTTGGAPLEVKFTDTSLCNPLEWHWDFDNDGIIDSREKDPTHIFNDIGVYTVKLTVTNLAGSAECEGVITVVPRVVDMDVSLRADLGWATVYDEIVLSIDLKNTGTDALNNLHVILTISGLTPTVYLDEYVHLAAGGSTTITYRYEVSWWDTEHPFLAVHLDVLTASGEEFSDHLSVSMVRTTYSWTSSGGDSYNSGLSYEAGPIGPEAPVLKWYKDLDGSYYNNNTFSQPLIVETRNLKGEIVDVVLVGRPWPMAIDLHTGIEIWNRSTDLRGGLYTPVYHDGVLYIFCSDLKDNSNNFKLYALNARNGATLWESTELIGTITPIKYDDGRLYVGAYYTQRNAGLFCVDANDGKVLWSVKNYFPAQFGAPAIVGNYVIWPSGSGSKIVVTEKTTGAISDVVDLNTVVTWGEQGLIVPNVGAIKSSVVYSPETGRIYLTTLGAWVGTSFKGILLSMDYDPIKGDVIERANWLTYLPLQSSASPVVYDGKVYVGTGSHQGGTMYECRERDGAFIGTVSPGSVQCNPVLSLYGKEPVLYWSANQQNGLGIGYGIGERPGFYFEPKEKAYYTMSGAVPYKGFLVYMNDLGYIFCLESYAADPSLDPQQSVNYESATIGNLIEYELDLVNDGNIDFRNVKVKVTMEGYAISGYTIVDDTIDLLAGSSRVYRFSYSVNAMDVQGTSIKFSVVCTVDGHVFADTVSVIMVTPAFRIDSDAEMDEFASSRGWAGSGTADDPYVISGYYVDGRDGGIFIGNTTRHFILRDVEVSGNTAGAGVELLNVINGIIADSFLHDNRYGIHAKSSSVIIRSNVIENNTGYGVLLEGCVNSKVYSNHFIANNGAGSSYAYGKRQATDNGKNAWDVGGTGNLWSDILQGTWNSYQVSVTVYDRYPLGVNDADWEGSMDDAQGSGSNTAPSPDDAEEYWTAVLGSPLVCEPIMADGLVIFLTVEGLYVFSDDGTMLWSDRSYPSDNGTTPCCSDGIIYVAYPKTPVTASIVVQAYDAFIGNVLWTVNDLDDWKKPSSPLRVYDGLVYLIASRDDRSAMLCLDNRSGEMQWMFECNGAKGFVLVGDHVILARNNGTLFSLSTSSGLVIDEVDIFEHFPILSSNLSSSISYDVVTCSLFMVTEGRDLVCLGFDPLSGKFLPAHVRQGYTVPLKFPGSTPAVSGDSVYVISGNLVYAIDKLSGEVKWMHQLRSSVTSSPAVSTYYDGDLVYIVCEERVICLGPDGRMKWQLAPKDYGLCYDSTYGAAIAQTLLAYGNDRGNVMVIKKKVDLSLNMKIETNQWDAKVGDKITVTLTLTNDGNVRLDGMPLYFLRIVNNDIVDRYIDIGTTVDLAIGQTVVYRFTYVVTQHDFDYGSIYFKAAADYVFRDASFDIVLYHALGMTHDPFVIDGDDELRDFADEFNLMGNGTAANPFVLAAWLINAEDARYCISISNTTLHFIISDCVFHNATDASARGIRSVDDNIGWEYKEYWRSRTGSTTDWEAHPHDPEPAPWAGIRLYQASNITIQGSEFEKCYVSIEMFDCKDIVIDNVEIELYPAAGSSGINIADCERIVIRNSHVVGLDLEDAEAFQEALEIDTIPELESNAQYDLVEWYGVRAASSADIVIEGSIFENFRPYHFTYADRRWENDERRPGIDTDAWIRGYETSWDAWAVYVNSSSGITLWDNTFTESHTVVVRIDSSEGLLIDKNSFGSYIGYFYYYPNALHQSGRSGELRDPVQNLQLNGCTDIELTNNRLYNSQLIGCTSVLVNSNEIMVLNENRAESYMSGVLFISGTNVVVSNNMGGNLYLSGGAGQVVRDNSYRTILLERVYDSVVSGNIPSSSPHDMYVRYPSIVGQPVVSGTIILSDSDRNLISNNVMNIYLYGSSYNDIRQNTMEGGKSYGGYCLSHSSSSVTSGGWGGNTMFRYSPHISSESNMGFSGVGLEIAGAINHQSNYNVVWNNTISNTLLHGIRISNIYCSFNLIYENVLNSNNGATKSFDLSEQAQALDRGYLNQWNSTDKRGNYWSDWQHRNGPYCVSNGTVAEVAYDLYPLSFPLEYWEQHHMDGKGTAAIDSNGLFDPNNLTADWSFVMNEQFTGAITVEPVTGDGKVFVIDANSYIYAIDIDSGELRWIANPVWGDNRGIESCTPAYDGKVLYVVLQSRISSTYISVVALSTVDGSVLWTNSDIDAQGGRVDAPVRYDSGRIYFGSSGTNASFYCLSATNGSTLWSYKTAGDVRGGAAVFGDYVVFGDLSGMLYVLNTTGVVKSTFDVNSRSGIDNAAINSTVVYADGRLYFTASSKTVGYCISLGIDASGTLKTEGIRWTTMDPTSSTPSLYGGYLYVGSGAPGSTYGRLYCIEADTGGGVWSRVLEGPVLSSPAIMIMFHGDIYVGVTIANTIGGLYIYDNDGDRVFAHIPPEAEAGRSMQGAAIFDEAMIYANSRGYVYSIASNGSIPKAAFIAVPVDGAVPLEVQFMDCSSYDPTSWEWDLDGDGIVDSYEEDPIFTYPAIGKYNITLKVTNFKGTAQITREYYIDVQPRNPSIDAASVASRLSVTHPGDEITYTLTIKNDGNLHLFGVTVDTVLIAHLRDGGTEMRYFSSQTVNAVRNVINNFYLDYAMSEDDEDCIFLEAIYYVNHTVEGLSYKVSSGVYIRVPHDPIAIDGDDDLVATADAEGWKGDGSADDPFIIENYHIEINSIYWTDYFLDDGVPRAIYLRDISLHVIIRNCTTVAITLAPMPTAEYQEFIRQMNENITAGTIDVWLTEQLRTMTIEEITNLINNGGDPRVTAIHVLMIDCSNITLSNSIITPLAEYSRYLNDNLNYGIVMIDCRDNLVEDVSMPSHRAHAYLGYRHSVNTAVYLENSHDNVIRNLVVEERSYTQSGVVVKPQVVLLSGSEGNTLENLNVRSGGITVSSSDRTTIINAYARNGLVISDSDGCILRSFTGYAQSDRPGFSHTPSTITVTNCASLHILDSIFTDTVALTGCRDLRVEGSTFVGAKLEMRSCQNALIDGNVFEQNCGTAIGMIDCSDVTITNNDMDMLWYIWLERPGSMIRHQHWMKGMGISMNAGCSGGIVANNNIINGETGIAARGAGNLVRDNIIVNCTAGILLNGSDVVKENTLEDCVNGIRMVTANGATVVGNHLFDSDIYIGHNAKNTLVDANLLQDGTFILDVTSSTSANLRTIDITDANTVNGGSFVFHIGKDMDGEVISEAGQLLLIDVRNLIIDGLVVDGGYNAVTIISSQHITIRNAELSNMVLSVALSGCDYVVIEDSHLQGLSIASSMYCNVTACVINGTLVNGITINSSRYIGIDDVVVSNGTSNGIAIVQSQDVDVRYCVIENNGANGIMVNSFSSRVNIQHNHLISNYRNSIYFENANHCNVLNNTMVDGLNGVLCESSDFNVIRNNVFAEHLRYGVSFGPNSDNNVVVNNHFDGNRGSGSFFRSYFVQAEDLGAGNKWSDADGGNYWYDWQNMQGMHYVILRSLDTPVIFDAKPLDLRYIDQWNSPGHDNHRSGHSSSSAPSSNTTAWTRDDFRFVDGSSIVSGAGMIFLQSVDVNGRTMLCAFGAETGELVWSVQITGSRASSTFTPVYHLGLVYAPGGAYDAFTGKQVWKDAVTDHAGGGYIVHNSIAVIGDWGTNSLLAYNATTGQLLWTLPLVGFPESTPTLCGDDIIVTTVSEQAGNVYRISIGKDVSENERVIWSKTFDGHDNRTVGSAVVDGDVIYLTTLNTFGYGHLYALNAADGEEIWSTEIVSSASSVAVADGRIYVSSGFDDALGRMTYCIDAADGHIIWSVKGVGSAYCSPTVADGKVFVGNHETGLLYGELWFLGTYVLNAETGAEVWHSELGGSSAMIYDGRVYTIGDGMLAVFGE